MIETHIKIRGLEKLRDGLRKYPQKSIVEINNAIKKSVLTVQRNTMRGAPVGKRAGGNLRQSIKSRTVRLAGEVRVGADYAIFVEAGTRPHIIKVKNKKVLADRRAGIFFGKKVKHPGTKPNPFFAKGIKQSISKIRKYFADSAYKIASLK